MVEVSFYIRYRGGRAVDRVQGVGDIGDDVLYAQEVPQGTDVLTSKVLLGGIGEAVVVAHIGAARCDTVGCPSACCCLPTQHTTHQVRIQVSLWDGQLVSVGVASPMVSGVGTVRVSTWQRGCDDPDGREVA
ncbi:hypothetical protein Pmani_004034 [Petrolisthes manimaculis]|uniref:Uncharacterized protein n=1 Tax=Petrolisthes manimaculis TaxID=1843537 RepID=A0AAE1QHM4_9EUCA|nr:hypothetical protein Pmani_004034 [Petrolisthes manimaculis]